MNHIEPLFDAIADDLDIPAHLHESAVLKYEEVGNWLNETGTELSGFSPRIYPQGSFALGTVVRPIDRNGEYDVDLVCVLEKTKEQTTQAELKKLVGDRLRANEDFKKALSSTRRCWTITYPKQFHLDVLPSIPNPDNRTTGILITDRELKRWLPSDPLGYVGWFKTRMAKSFESAKLALASSRKTAPDDIPEWQVKTDLQRAIQVLKRHRDIFFATASDLRTPSVILTTLSGIAYSGQSTTAGTLASILPRFSQNIAHTGNRWEIRNPVDAKENFADKWNEDEQLPKAFFAWLEKAERDFSSVLKEHDLKRAGQRLEAIVGGNTYRRAASKAGLQPAVAGMQRTMEPVAPPLADSSHSQNPPWPMQTMYGSSMLVSVHSKRDGRRLWTLKDQTVPKKAHLRFELKTDLPKPYDVKWQVVNTGAEALAAKQPRGGFESDNGGHGVRWEHTSYLGTHWVEGFILRNGICVGRTGRFLVKVR